jgi:oligoendopeptidase F
MHEGGHAMHSFQVKDMYIISYKNTPSESAELASMSMELISMDYWDIFYDNEKDLNKAKREQLEGTIKMLPWVMIVDAFQHWIYTNSEHTPTQREDKFVELLKRFDPEVVDWQGYEKYRAQAWVYQLHITTVPFYYIEYAIAQLGALQIWRNYKTDPEKAINDYLNALSLGNSKPLPEVYKAAGIKFDFSRKTISELMNFVKKELENYKE